MRGAGLITIQEMPKLRLGTRVLKVGNYSYSSGNVPRRRIPVYHQLPYQGVPVPISNSPYRFGVGRGYRLRTVNKPFKPNLNRQRRPDQRNKKVSSPLKNPHKTMQAQSSEKQELLQEKNEETYQGELTGVDQVVKNGPEKCSSHNEDLKKDVMGKLENGTPEVAEENPESYESNGITAKSVDETGKMKSKSKHSKEKKAKKSSTPSKGSPKGNSTPSKGKSPKSKKETKPDIEEETETENKEKENLQDKKELESKSRESSVASDIHTSVKVTHHTPSVCEIFESNDSIIEIPIEDQNELHENPPSTSEKEIPSKLPDTHTVKDSPRRSSRLAVHHTPPKQRSPAKPDSSSIIVLDSDDSITVLEENRTHQDQSFAQTLRSMSGRRSLRSLPVYNRSFNRPSFVGSASIHSNISSRSITTADNDSESESQETKILHPKAGLWGLFHSPGRNAPQDSATDNEESTNRSIGEDSGNDSEETFEPPFEVASNISFGKRKTRDDEIIDEVEQENKRLREDDDDENNSPNTAGLFSIVSSPMNLFASKIRGDKGKSSTPVQLLKDSAMDEEEEEEEEKEDFLMHQDSVSKIQYEDENPRDVSEKDNLADLSSNVNKGQEVAQRRWCSVM